MREENRENNWRSIVLAQHFYITQILILSALQIKNPNLVSTIPAAIIFVAVILSAFSALYLLIKFKLAQENKQAIRVGICILLTIAGNWWLLSNM